MPSFRNARSRSTSTGRQPEWPSACERVGPGGGASRGPRPGAAVRRPTAWLTRRFSWSCRASAGGMYVLARSPEAGRDPIEPHLAGRDQRAHDGASSSMRARAWDVQPRRGAAARDRLQRLAIVTVGARQDHDAGPGLVRRAVRPTRVVVISAETIRPGGRLRHRREHSEAPASRLAGRTSRLAGGTPRLAGAGRDRWRLQPDGWHPIPWRLAYLSGMLRLHRPDRHPVPGIGSTAPSATWASVLAMAIGDGPLPSELILPLAGFPTISTRRRSSPRRTAPGTSGSSWSWRPPGTPAARSSPTRSGPGAAGRSSSGTEAPP